MDTHKTETDPLLINDENGDFDGERTNNDLKGRRRAPSFSFSSWEHATKGSVTKFDLSKIDLSKYHSPHEPFLGQFRATAIAGNDITSSIFYTAGQCIPVAGKYTPISMALVVTALFLFRNIYTEVCTALPLNGGTYNVLLNVTTKGVASVAAALSMLSYLVTSVVSANTAASYLNDLYSEIPVVQMTIAILGVFALLNLLGLSESATVALTIFIMHLMTLSLLALFSIIQFAQEGTDILTKNWERKVDYSPPIAIYLGYSVALLGVSGFESSANYIEEQKEGVFAKTLRNMWICIMIFNPLLSFLAISILKLEDIDEKAKLQTHGISTVLADMADKTRYGHTWLKMVVGIDAVIVLSGAVLTAYVGVIGLVKRMAMDRCLPSFLLSQNPWRKTNHWIIIGFFLIATSLCFLKVDILTGVYTCAFLSVMALFAIGNILMKYKRKKLPRLAEASWIEVFLGLILVVAGLIGNIIFNTSIVIWFSIYFFSTMLLISLMFGRIRILRVFLFCLRDSPFLNKCFGDWATNTGKKIKSRPMVFFTKTDELQVLNKAILYVLENEITNCLKVVHVYSDESKIPTNLIQHIEVLDQMYPKLTIDLILIKGTFSPEITNHLVELLNIPKNLMFITCPGNQLKYKISEFGGLRVITH